MECHGRLNLLKTGIAFSHTISTVSPRYALEIQHEPMGCGLGGVLRDRSDVLKGIINGIDDQVWNPQTDSNLVTRYDVRDWRAGKAANKSHLQQQFGLEQRDETPLIGSVGRLVSQKGWELILQILPQWLRSQDAQWIVLGTGDPVIERQLRTLAAEFPRRLAVQFAFSDQLAHQIEAGSDMFLMPSQYEPCGLNQLYSLRYGSVPVVRETGGLADTIVDLEQAQADRPANGFSFAAWDAAQLHRTLLRAVGVYAGQAEVWGRLVETGMRQDWSWNASAAKYAQLYRQTVARRNQIQVPLS
jgi:starch synthase